MNRDLHGRLAGDQVLKDLAALLRQVCRPGDVCARYGGEAFQRADAALYRGKDQGRGQSVGYELD